LYFSLEFAQGLHTADDNNIMASEDENIDVETSDEVDVSQPMDMQEEGAVIDTCRAPMRTLMDIDTVVSRHMPPTEAVSLTVTSKTSKEKVPQREARGPYRRYTADQIEQ
jgi:hypothetical protein